VSARKASDFSLFKGYLQQWVDVSLQKAAAIDPSRPAYDVSVGGGRGDVSVAAAVVAVAFVRKWVDRHGVWGAHVVALPLVSQMFVKVSAKLKFFDTQTGGGDAPAAVVFLSVVGAQPHAAVRGSQAPPHIASLPCFTCCL
jgi:hypothetical protein